MESSPRIVIARFSTEKKTINITVIQCYVSTNDASNDTKEEFYEELQSLVNRQFEKDITYIHKDEFLESD